MIDLSELSRLRKCSSLFMLACYNIAYSNIQVGDISKAFEAYTLSEFVIKKCYRKQDQMYKTADKTRRFANVTLRAHIWKVEEFYRIAFETFNHSGMEFFHAKREGLVKRVYKPIPTKKLIKKLVKTYQGKVQMLKIIKEQKIKEIMLSGSERENTDLNLFQKFQEVQESAEKMIA